MTGGWEFTDDILIDVIRRRSALTALQDAAMSKRELADAIDVSGATAHRILTSFKETGLVERTADGHVVTNLGGAIVREAERYHSNATAAYRLQPLFDHLGTYSDGFDVEVFADATITVAEPIDPYRPINRFVELLQESDSLRGFDTTSVSPTYVEDVHEMILDGMPVEIVYDPTVIDRLATEYADLAGESFDRENLTIWVADDVPFGLALFDDRVGIGGYDDETGLLQTFVDTDDPDAIAWGERLFEQLRDEATQL